MNKTGKSISMVLYVIALAICAIVHPGVLAIVAIIGMGLFFAVHLTLRARGGGRGGPVRRY
jgi:uncharacterized membrane protein YdjX (TVP38/TMEM64 family)